MLELAAIHTWPPGNQPPLLDDFLPGFLIFLGVILAVIWAASRR